mmetsp:Transcript_6683/g.9719  ORF Transcript_6683/g.9719 Transcript_6683/m.9719 type:complete len:112 (-) Transcript_6683:716-1051(-)
MEELKEESKIDSRRRSKEQLFHDWRRGEDIIAMENALVALENRLNKDSAIEYRTWSTIKNSFALLERATSESSWESDKNNDDLLAQIESLRGKIKRLRQSGSLRGAREILE